MKEIKTKKDEGDISEDDYYRQEEEVQKILDEYNKKIPFMLSGSNDEDN